jgi:UPF0755 protein
MSRQITKKYSTKPNLSSNNPFKLIFLVILTLIIIFGIWGIMNAFSGTPYNSPKNDNYPLEIKKGDNLTAVGAKLAKENALSQPLSLTALAQTKDRWILQPGSYKLKLPANPEQIMAQLKTQSEKITKDIEIENAKPKNTQSVKITFKEGDTVDDIIAKLVKNNLSNEESLKTFAQNPTNFDQKDYPFLPKPLDCQYGDVKNCAKYYIEGYLYPDTYEFFGNSTNKDIFEKMLDNFSSKVWSKINLNLLAGKDFSKIVNMASVIERETGRPIDGVNSLNIEDLKQEKSTMAGAFFNRLEKGMKWQSDPTVLYGTGKSLCQQTLVSQQGCLYLDSPEADNKYNTYQQSGYPIGPTTNPTLTSIQAVISPQKNDYLLFVSDASGKKYFAKTNEEHLSNIEKANEINKQYRK